MTDNRGALAQDRTSFYPADTTAIPTMRGPEDMPGTPFGQAFGAGWRTAQDDWPGQSNQVLLDAYGPVIEALRARNRRPLTRYVNVEARLGFPLNQSTVWSDIAEQRRSDPGFLKEIGADQASFEKQVTERTKVRRQRDLGAIERSRGMAGAAALGGQFAGAMADPINLMTLPMGGGAGGTVARRVLAEGLLNAGIEAFEQPLVAAERAKRGETLGAGEAIGNVAVAGLGGAAVQGVIVEPLSLLARKHLGWGTMTEDERAAVHVLEREAEIDATSPYLPGLGGEAHAERLADTMARIMADEPPMSARGKLLSGTALGSAPVPRETSAIAPGVSRAAPMPRAQFKAMVRGAESSGNDLAAAGTSSAFGRYQFTAPTWLRYYKRRYGAGGLSDAAILAKRADGAIQEQLMDDLTADNAAALARIGAPETPGNLYLMHFAGQGGAGKVLRAAEDVPLRDLLTADAIAANPFLRDMTAGDLRRWADRKMGGTGEVGPVVRRDQFPDDAEGDAAWAAAQRESEMADLELAAIRRERMGGADAGEPEIALGRDIEGQSGLPRETGVEQGPLIGMDWEPAAVPVLARPRVLPVRNRPSDVIEYLADRGGIRDDEGHALRGSRDMGKVFVPRAGPLLRPGGMSIDQAGELLQEAGFFRDRPTTAQVLDMIERAVNSDEKIYPLHEQAVMAERAAKLKQQGDEQAFTDRLHETFGGLFTRDEDPELFGDVMAAVADGEDPWAALKRLTELRRQNALERAAQEGQDTGYEWWRDPELDIPFDRPADRAASPGIDGRTPEPGAQAGSGAARDAEREAGGPPALDAAALRDFDDPHGPAADAQVQSIEHDLRMLAVDPKAADFTVQLGEEGEARSVADVLAEWDADAAAIETIRGCL